jgi:hypothetical protein
MVCTSLFKAIQSYSNLKKTVQATSDIKLIYKIDINQLILETIQKQNAQIETYCVSHI